jgi:hypothetical protein
MFNLNLRSIQASTRPRKNPPPLKLSRLANTNPFEIQFYLQLQPPLLSLDLNPPLLPSTPPLLDLPRPQSSRVLRPTSTLFRSLLPFTFLYLKVLRFLTSTLLLPDSNLDRLLLDQRAAILVSPSRSNLRLVQV